jgi:DNA-binding response OmpR family regulator
MPHHFLLISAPDTLAAWMLNSAMQGDDKLTLAATPRDAVSLSDIDAPDAILWLMDFSDEEAAVAACHALRRHYRAPIVLLVHPRAGEEVLRGYRLGADAHIAIPCDRREFSARVNAVLRRMTPAENLL